MCNVQIDEEKYQLASTHPSVIEDDVVKRFVLFANVVMEDLCRDYSTEVCTTVIAPLTTNQIVAHYNAFKVLSVTDDDGKQVPFTYADGGIVLNAPGKYVMRYVRLPEEMKWDSQIMMPLPFFTTNVLLYGILREYYLYYGDYATAQLWDERFVGAVNQQAQRREEKMQSKAGNMPVERWT